MSQVNTPSKIALIILSIAAALPAQTTVPISLVVNWPPRKLVEAKYGPLPAWADFGEVIGCSKAPGTVHFGEGDVIATLRLTAGLQAFSRQDAFLLVSNSQAGSKKNIVLGWLRAGVKSAVDAKAAGLIGGGNRTGVAIVTTAEFINIVLPNLAGVLSLKQVIQYDQDGLQALMAIPAGRCTPPWSVLFAVPATPPVQAVCGSAPALCLPNARQPFVYDLEVPVDR